MESTNIVQNVMQIFNGNKKQLNLYIMLPEPEISILEVNQMRRTKCLVFTRVMGYLRPVESFNLGKKGEHKERIYFVENPNE